MKDPVAYPNPVQCALWGAPGMVIDRAHAGVLKTLETFEDERDHEIATMRCTECGQLYFYHWLEEADWDSGKDGQYMTLIPVPDLDAARVLATWTPLDLVMVSPRLQIDSPMGKSGQTIRWIARTPPPGGSA